ncbi:MAG TPA: TIGR00296 family protein, partial [Nitrososphaeraceae archaeon]
MAIDEITTGEGIDLVRLARKSVESFIKNKKIINSTTISNKKAGVFVTIYHVNNMGDEKNLRGCIGYVFPSNNIYNSVIAAAINAATEDPRFMAISEKELNEVIFEVSVLTKPSLIQIENTDESIKKIVIGRDGLLLESRYGSGLFLPQVPVEQKWNNLDYLSNLCYKAGAPSDAWLLDDSKLYTFSSLIFRERLPN